MRYVYSNEIYHYGIPGMKWGIRRFQNPDGTLTAAGRRRYGTVENLERSMTKKQAAEHDEAKKAAISSGKAAEVQKFSSELTREEMAYAVQRIRDEQTLSDLRAKDVAAGQQKVKAIIDAGGQLKTAGETVKNVYNLVAQANNAFNKEHKMPIIGQDSNNKKPGEKSIEQQTKEFALERMKQKAKWEDEDRANKQKSDTSSNASQKESKSDNKSKNESTPAPSSSGDFSSNASQKESKSESTPASSSSGNSSIINRMVNNTGSAANAGRDTALRSIRDSRSGNKNELASSVNSFLDKPSVVERINNAYDSATNAIKTAASLTTTAFDNSVASGDDWVRRHYGV